MNGSSSDSGAGSTSSSSSGNSSILPSMPSMGNMFSGFSSPSEAGATPGEFGFKEFMESNSYVAKFAFILMVFILFSVFLRLGVMLIAFLFSPGTNPILLDGTIQADDMRTISQNPKEKGSVAVIRSTNEQTGIECTWSVWVNIAKPPVNSNYSRVFNKGTYVSKQTSGADAGIYTPNNAPGLYVKSDTDGQDKVVTLAAVINVANASNKSYYEKLEVKNVPLGRWVNVMIRITNNTVDVYINGRLAKRHKVNGVPMQNYGDVYIGEQGTESAFSGMISTLQYFNYALGTTKIISVVDAGPNKKMMTKGEGEEGGSVTASSYLSTQWYFNNNKI
jgi:hypothetical protein